MKEQNKISEKELVEKLFGNVTSEVSIQFIAMCDVFAKEGNLLSKFIASNFNEVDAVDIVDYSESYKKNLGHPKINFHVMDNREFALKIEKTYDLILMDNPICEISGETAEHFGLINQIAPLISAKGNTVLLFNTSLEPYDYDSEKNRNWKKIRNNFYKKENTARMSWRFMAPFYISYFQRLGLEVLFYDRVARRSTEEGDPTTIDLNLIVLKRK